MLCSNNLNASQEWKIDDNFIASWANIAISKLWHGSAKQTIIWNGTTNNWSYIYDLVDSTNRAFLNLNYVVDASLYKLGRFCLHTNTTNDGECEIALINNINYGRGFFLKSLMRGWNWWTDSFAIYQCNVATVVFDYNVWNLGNITIGYPLKAKSWVQTTTSDNSYVTYYQYKNLTSINNNILWIQSLLISEATQYYVLNFNGTSFIWWLLGDNNISWLWQWKILNLWSDLWTINSTLWSHTTWINTLNSYFPITDANLWSTNLTNAMSNISTLNGYFSSWKLNLANMNTPNDSSKFLCGTSPCTWTTLPGFTLSNPYTNNWPAFTWQNQISANNQLNSFNIYSYNPWAFTGIKTSFEFGNDSSHGLKNYYQYWSYDWNIVSFTNGNQNIYQLNNNGSVNFVIYGFLQHQYWTLSVSNDAYFITFYQFKQLLNINNNILWKNALLTSEASQYQVLNYNGWSFQYSLLNDNNIWGLNISKLWNINDNTKFLCSWNPCSWSYVNKMINNGAQIYLNKLTDGDAHPLTRVEIWYSSLPCNVEFD